MSIVTRGLLTRLLTTFGFGVGIVVPRARGTMCVTADPAAFSTEALPAGFATSARKSDAAFATDAQRPTFDVSVRQSEAAFVVFAETMACQ